MSRHPEEAKIPLGPQRSTVLKTGLEIGLGVIGLAAVALFLWFTSEVLLVFFAAIFLAVFFSGVAKFLESHTRFGYTTCAAFTFIGLAQLVILVILVVGPSIAAQFVNLSDALPKAYHQITDEMKRSPAGAHLLASIQAASKGGAGANILKVGGMSINGLGGMIFALVIAIFLTFQPQLYRVGFLNLFPEDRKKRIEEVLDEVGYTLWWWLLAQLVVMTTVGVLVSIGLSILGVPLALTLGLIAAALSFIPSLGPLISVIPALLLGLSVSPVTAVWVALLYLGVMTLESNVITPLIQRKAISLPPAFVMASELLMGLVLGAAGLAFATPLAGVGLVLVNMLYIQDVLKAKGSLPSEQEA